MDKDILLKAKNAKNAEEIRKLGAENNFMMSEQNAEDIYKSLHQSGELSDDELDSVSGGACYDERGFLKVTVGYGCKYFESTGELGREGTCCVCQYFRMHNTGNEYTMPLAALVGVPGKCIHPYNRAQYVKYH